MIQVSNESYYDFFNSLLVIYEPEEGYVDRHMEQDDVLRRYVDFNDEARRYIEVEEDNLYKTKNEICECSHPSDQKTSTGQPYEHIR